MVLWCIRNDPRSPNGERLRRACEAVSAPHLTFDIEPGRLPDVPTDSPVIFYGSSFFIRDIARSGRWTPGTFFDETVFRFLNYLERFGERMLNADADILPLAEVAGRNWTGTEQLFIRSDNDLKEIPGCVWSARDFGAFSRKLLESGDPGVGETRIVIAPKKRIEYEWRMFIVDGMASTASQYRFWGDLELSPNVPRRVIEFAEATAALWSPAPVFVMDIASVGESLFVLEVNAFNSSGFYRADVEKLVLDVSRAIEK
jgi:hypothetical protein